MSQYVEFEHDRREEVEEVLDYVYAPYAREHAAITCTVQTYRAPNAALDAGRATCQLRARYSTPEVCTVAGR